MNFRKLIPFGGIAGLILFAGYCLDQNMENQRKYAKGLAALGWPTE